MKLYLLPNLERPILISLINICPLICSFLLFELYSVFNDHRSLPSVNSDKNSSRPHRPRRLRGRYSCRIDAIGHLVGTSGLEPPTSRLSGARSNHLSYAPLWLLVASSPSCSGGDDGNRTHDPLLAGQVLSQLSYTPIGEVNSEE